MKRIDVYLSKFKLFWIIIKWMWMVSELEIENFVGGDFHLSYWTNLNLPVRLFLVKYSWMRLLCSLYTRQMAAECSVGKPSCCNSVENVISSVWNRVAFTNKNRIHDMADLIDFKSLLFVMNELFNLASCNRIWMKIFLYLHGKNRNMLINELTM